MELSAIETQPSTIEIRNFLVLNSSFSILAIDWAGLCCRRVSSKDYQMSRVKKPKLSAESEYFATMHRILIPRLLASLMTWVKNISEDASICYYPVNITLLLQFAILLF